MSLRPRVFSAFVVILGSTLAAAQIASCAFEPYGTEPPPQSTPCVNDSNCDDKNPCTVDECLEDGTCSRSNAADGPLPLQIAGDCRRDDCVAGVLVPTNDDADIDDDDEPCTADSCVNGNPVHAPLADSTMCAVGAALGNCTMGVCTVHCGPTQPCDDKNPCTEDSCNAGVGTCIFAPLNGLPTPGVNQPAGDCRLQICENGVDTAIEDNADVPDDMNSCTQNVCTAGVPSNPVVVAGTSCVVGQLEVCDGKGQCVECTEAAHCKGIVEDECTKRNCVSNKCEPLYMGQETLASAALQTLGNCMKVVCDGAGGTTTIADNADLPDDGNACTKDICTDGAPSNPVEALNTACGNGLVCNATGVCVGCNTADQCDGTDNFCGIRTCINQECGWSYTAVGTDLDTGQTAGDCKVLECDGAGNVVTSVLQSDVPADGNACTQDVCNAQGNPSNPPTSMNSPCDVNGNDACDGNGACKKSNSKTCAAAGECVSNSCVDGVCCNATCSGVCTSCNLAGSVGTCIPVPTNNEDPPGCTSVNSCDGAGTCKKDDGQGCVGASECVSGYCADGVCCNVACSDVCQACIAPLNGATNGICGNIAIGTDPQNECLNGSCNGSAACKLDLGAPCSVGPQCLSDNCVDGVCCNTACTGTCQACSNVDKGQGVDGACGPIITNTDPNNECTNGACNGASACKLEQGIACGVDGDCLSGHCIDGVCCNSACTGLCEACSNTLTGQTNGTCAPVTAGTDPNNECATQDASTCGTTGVCNGSGACALYTSGTICVAQSCTGSTQQNAHTCNGSGTCNPGGTTNCSPYDCNGTACKTSCAGDADCLTGFFCSGTSCVPLLANGATCSVAAHCLSGNCIDGVCCNSACTGLCEACSNALTGQTNGTCAPATAGTDPDDQCATQPASTCGTTGVCNGSGACALYTSGTICVAQSCTGSTQQNAHTCNGTGTCNPAGTTDCSPYQCNGTACKTSCAGDSDCLGGFFCSGTSCVPLLANGATCSAAAYCLSGNCVDGVCCNSACTGLCEACSNALTGQTNGTCAPATAGTDPDDQCATQPASTCGTTGVCNGSGACALYTSGTICVAKSCTGSTQQNAHTCNGTGTCNPAGTTDCSPYNCDGTACKTTCTGDADCLGGFFCSGTSCVPLLANGATCSAAAHCVSGNCVDGVCCNSACTGLCEACSNALTGQTNGTCAPVTAGTDPDDECATQLASTCGTTGVCNGSGACALHTSGTICVAQSCTGSSQQNAHTCNGTGTCNPGSIKDCSPYNCDGTACKTACTADADCLAGFFCSGTSCVPLLANGAACIGGADCLSGNCVDDICCDTACTDACMACNVPSALGTCSKIPLGDDDNFPMGICSGSDVSCDGGGACKYENGATCPGNVADCFSGICADGVCCDGSCDTTCMTCNLTGFAGTCSNVPANQDDPDATVPCAGLTESCDGAGVCRGELGEACTANGDCLSNFCVDLVCCNSPCAATCYACSATKQGQGTDGTCGPIASGDDPDAECAGPQTCDGNGACQN